MARFIALEGMNKLPEQETGCIVIAARDKQIRLHADHAGLRAMAAWINWLVDCTKSENRAICAGWSQDAQNVAIPIEITIVADNPRRDVFFGSDIEPQGCEVTALVADSHSLREILNGKI
jgi:hypothetical protein